MPELPDVEAFRATVRQHFIHCLVSNVVISDPKCLEGVTVAMLQRRLKGRGIQGTGRHGKYLFLDFGDDIVLVMHFGPAGSLQRVADGQEQPDYVRFQLDFSNSESLAYVNRRRIGRLRLVANVAAFIEQAGLGPDAMAPDFNFPGFAHRVSDRGQPIKVFLTDQSNLAGIGNTWSDEILFQARMHPAIRANSLGAARTRHLFNSMRRVLKIAIDLDPSAADFEARLPSDFLLPHRHPGGHCPRCATALERVVLSGHPSTYCPHCQKAT
jgi:formamidopyrimidine-DNA glycosylase